jgi:hypothetical protein
VGNLRASAPLRANYATNGTDATSRQAQCQRDHGRSHPFPRAAPYRRGRPKRRQALWCLPCPSRSARATAWRSARHPRRAAGRAASTLAIPSVSPSLPGEPDAPGPGATVRRLEIAASCRSIWPGQVRREVVSIPNTKRSTHALISGRDNLLTQNQIHSGRRRNGCRSVRRRSSFLAHHEVSPRLAMTERRRRTSDPPRR